MILLSKYHISIWVTQERWYILFWYRVNSSSFRQSNHTLHTVLAKFVSFSLILDGIVLLSNRSSKGSFQLVIWGLYSLRYLITYVVAISAVVE